MTTVYLKKNKEESLRRFHPWVFSGAVARADGRLQDGDIVRVCSAEGEVLGVGHWQESSIAVRMLSFDASGTLPTDFFEERIHTAYIMRHAMGLDRPDNNCYRLVHGEGDFLPGLVIDIYDNIAVLQAHSAGMHVARQQIAQAICSTLKHIKGVYYKSEGTLPLKRTFTDIQDGWLVKAEKQEYVATENGLRFYIDWLRGQKTGFFLDQRNNRSLVEKYAEGRRVLNMFCYTGGFSVYAMRGGASIVHSVDSSAKATDLACRNMELNFSGCERHQAFTDDAFRFLDNTTNGCYDLIILDPPAFAKHRDAVKNAIQGYRRLNEKAFEKIAAGGILFTFSCSQAIDKQMFRLAVFTAAANTGRKVRILHQLHQPEDHPVSIYHPEGEYLKGLVLYVE